MEQVIGYRSYQEYKQELDTELKKTAEGFVRIGYLLKVARDTSILTESQYDNVIDFARAEYGLDKTQVSRFMNITNCPVSAFQQYIQDSGRRLLVLIDVYGFDGLILHGHHEFLVGHLLAE